MERKDTCNVICIVCFMMGKLFYDGKIVNHGRLLLSLYYIIAQACYLCQLLNDRERYDMSELSKNSSKKIYIYFRAHKMLVSTIHMANLGCFATRIVILLNAVDAGEDQLLISDDPTYLVPRSTVKSTNIPITSDHKHTNIKYSKIGIVWRIPPYSYGQKSCRVKCLVVIYAAHYFFSSQF